MKFFKLTPKPQADYRTEVREIQKTCKLEKHGYRHNKIIYGFCDALPDTAEFQSLGLNIEKLNFDKTHLSLTNDLIERGRAKSKLDHLKEAKEKNGSVNEQEQVGAERRLSDLNNNIQAAKEALGITGILKILKF